MFGTMVNRTDTLVGYFSFDREISQNGQTVYYVKDPSSGRVRTFQSRKYDYFQGDSIYMEKFGGYSAPGGKVDLLIPRIIDGRIQLFELTFKWGRMSLAKSDRFSTLSYPIFLLSHFLTGSSYHFKLAYARIILPVKINNA